MDAVKYDAINELVKQPSNIKISNENKLFQWCEDLRNETEVGIVLNNNNILPNEIMQVIIQNYIAPEQITLPIEYINQLISQNYQPEQFLLNNDDLEDDFWKSPANHNICVLLYLLVEFLRFWKISCGDVSLDEELYPLAYAIVATIIINYHQEIQQNINEVQLINHMKLCVTVGQTYAGIDENPLLWPLNDIRICSDESCPNHVPTNWKWDELDDFGDVILGNIDINQTVKDLNDYGTYLDKVTSFKKILILLTKIPVNSKENCLLLIQLTGILISNISILINNDDELAPVVIKIFEILIELYNYSEDKNPVLQLLYQYYDTLDNIIVDNGFGKDTILWEIRKKLDETLYTENT